LEQLTQKEREILAYVASQGSASRAEIAQRFGMAANTAGVHLFRLASKGQISLVDKRKGHTSRWTIKQQSQQESTKPVPASVWDLGRL
jgi:predicted ArsR family transcriptional regulator